MPRRVATDAGAKSADESRLHPVASGGMRIAHVHSCKMVAVGLDALIYASALTVSITIELEAHADTDLAGNIPSSQTRCFSKRT